MSSDDGDEVDHSAKEGDYALWAVFGISVITIIFAIFMYFDAVEIHRELYGIEEVTKRGFWGNTYQV